VLVRNRSGVSHAPEEHVDLEDAAAGVAALVRAVDGAA
jgi:acetylornithine deacetylase/succinyl-diaminopimelate desuccinylase-like protein